METLEQMVLMVQGAAEFRARKAKEYPDDARNGIAAKALEQLTEQLAKLPVSDARLRHIEKLEQVLVLDGCYPHEAINQLVSRVGFDHDFKDANDFVWSYIGILRSALDDQKNVA